MRRIALILSSLLVVAPVARADEPAAVEMPRNGVPGVWVREDVARRALGCLDAAEPEARRVRLLEADLELRRSVEAELRASYAAAGRALLAADERTAAARRELRRPRHNAWIWLSVGLVLGLGGASAIVIAR